MRVNGNVYTLVPIVLIHHRYSITNNELLHLQCVIKNDDRMSDGKLLSNQKMLLMAKQPLPTSISIISISCSTS